MTQFSFLGELILLTKNYKDKKNVFENGLHDKCNQHDKYTIVQLFLKVIANGNGHFT